MTRAAVYARISRAEDGDRAGVDRQLQDCRRVAHQRGWEVIEELVDNDRPASRFSRKDREGYRRLLALIDSHEIDAVVIWMEDRLHRQVIELAEFLKACEQAGVTRVASVGAEFDLSNPDERIMLYIKAAMAEAEVEKSSRRIRRQRLEAAERGERHAGGSREFGTVGVGKNAVSEAQAAAERDLIAEAAARILAGDSLRGIVLDWLDRGIKTSTGRLFVNASLRQMLKSPRIAGYRVHHGKWYPGQWEPIIPLEQWKALAEILNDPKRRTSPAGGLRRYLLSGLIFCGRCGRPAYGRKGRVQGGRRQPTGYGCHGLREEGGCGGVRRKASDVEELICEALFIAVEGPAWDQVASRPAEDPSRELYEALASDQGLLDRLEDKVLEELVRPETARRKRVEIERRMDATRARLAQLGDRRVAVQVPRNLREVWPSLSLDRRRAILAAVIERVDLLPQGSGRAFDPDAVKVTWRV